MHIYVCVYNVMQNLAIQGAGDSVETRDFVTTCIGRRDELAVLLDILLQEANDGELAAFISYAIAFPDGFTALVDTYEVLRYFSIVNHPHCTATTSPGHDNLLLTQYARGFFID